MKVTLIIYSLIFFIQGPCAGCPSGNPCAGCCPSCGGPPPSPGFPIDNYIYCFLPL